MVQFYKNFLGASCEFENDRAAFLAYDSEHHRIGIIAFDNIEAPINPAPGLEHVAFTFENLEDLVLAYEQRKAYDILPVTCINHGPTTSMYYLDPDGNKLESQIDNFATRKEAATFLNSEEFANNPIGADFDPEELAQRVRSGENHDLIKRRPEVGLRKFPTILPAV